MFPLSPTKLRPCLNVLFDLRVYVVGMYIVCDFRLDTYHNSFFRKEGLTVFLIIFGKIHFLLILENSFFCKIKCDRITSLHGIHGGKTIIENRVTK